MDGINQLLRESRQLESVMAGVSSAFQARANGGMSGAAAGAPAVPPVVGSGALGTRVPLLTRNLAQLDAASAKLLRAQLPADPSTESQAQLLLSAKGIDVRKQQRALRELQSLHQGVARGGAAAAAGAVHMGLEQFQPADMERYLQQQQQLAVHAAMEEAAKVTADTYRRHDVNSLDDDWEQAKRHIMDGMGFRAGRRALGQREAAAESNNQAYLQQQQQQQAAKVGAGAVTPYASVNGPVLGMEQAIYARVISDLNLSRVKRAPIDLIQMMKQASLQVDEYFAAQGANAAGAAAAAANGVAPPGDVADCWDVVRFMLHEAAAPTPTGSGSNSLSPPLLLLEKQFASLYEADPALSPEATSFRTSLLEGSKRYTQHLFESFMRRVVAAHPEARQRGAGLMGRGGPNAANGGVGAFARLVAAYVSVVQDKLPPICRDLLLDGLPLWPQVYYCIRCGYLSDAIYLLQRATSDQGANGLSGLAVNRGGAASTADQSVGARTLLECLEQRVLKGGSATGGTFSAHQWIALHEEMQREVSQALNAARMAGAGHAAAASYVDPFKLCMYTLLGRFKLPQQFDGVVNMVAPTTEDFIWFKLSAIVTPPEGAVAVESSTTILGHLGVPAPLHDQIDLPSCHLPSLQSSLLQRGEGLFNPDGSTPLTWFKVLLMVGMVEQAVYALLKTPQFTVGVQFAVVLEHYGIMHRHNDARADLLVALPPAHPATGRDSMCVEWRYALAFVRVLRKYVESFVRSHPLEAFHYLYLLHDLSAAGSGSSAAAAALSTPIKSRDLVVHPLANNADADQAVSIDESFDAMRDLLLETRDWDLLAGSIVASSALDSRNGSAAADGDSIHTHRSLLYTFYTRQEASSILSLTARTLEGHGQQLDALHVYLLAHRFDRAVEGVLRLLADKVAQGVTQRERQAVVETAQKVQRVVRREQQAAQGEMSMTGGARVGEASDASLLALHQLLLLVNYFDLYHLGPQHYEDALTVLSSPELSLFPFHESAVAERARKYESVAATHPSLKRCMGDVAVSLMDIYYVQFQMVKREMQGQRLYQQANHQADQHKQQRLATLRGQARALLSFLGLVQNSMQIDSEVYAKLVSVEALMAA